MKLRPADIKNTTDYLILLNSLDIVKRKGKELWHPCDVINQIYSGNAAAMIGDNNDSLVFYTKKEDYTNENILWIWIAESKYANAIDHYLDDIKILAESFNCKKIQWSSKRTGYIRKLKTLTANIKLIEYQIEL
jgi:hypothetical protein